MRDNRREKKERRKEEGRGSTICINIDCADIRVGRNPVVVLLATRSLLKSTS